MMLRNRSQFRLSRQESPRRRSLYELFQCKDQESVSVKELFKYANWLDYLLVLLGLLGTLLMSQGWPVCTVLLGRSVDIFDTYRSALNISEFKPDSNQSSLAMDKFQSDMTHLIKMSLLSSGIYLLGSFAAIYFFKIVSIRQIERVKIRFFGQILRQSIAWHEEQNPGTITSMMVNDFKIMENGINENCAFLCYRIGSAIINVGLAVCFGWEITLLILCTVILTIIPLSVLIQLQSIFSDRYLDAASKTDSIVEQTISAVRTVFAYGAEDYERKHYEKSLQSETGSCRSRDVCVALSSSFHWLFICLGLSIGIYYGLPLLYRRPLQYTLSRLIIVFLCMTNFTYCIINCTPQFEALQSSRVAAAKIYKTIKLSSSIDSFSREGWQLRDYKADIELRNVHFSYSARADVKVLQDVSLKIRSGETIALVGPPGSGKSTLLRLLQRFHDLSHGEIYLDESNIELLNVGWLRSQIGSLSHNAILFDLTIEQNIRLGLPNDEINTTPAEVIIQAAKDANAHEFISRLPDGYATVVGERGFQLSGGQRQRIAVARTLVSNPRILLLDEASAHLDVKSEQIVEATLRKASIGRTTIIVTHRLSSIKHADRIVVMKDGRIVETGTHENLMASDSLYFRLVRAQELRIPSNASQYIRYLQSLSSWSTPSQGTESLDYQVNLKHEEKFVKTFPYRRFWDTFSFDRQLIYVALISVLSFGIGTTIFATLLGDIIDRARRYGPNDFIHAEYAFKYFLLGVSGFLLNFFSIVLFGLVCKQLSARLRVSAFGSILAQEMSWFDNPEHSPGAVCSILASHARSIHLLTGARLAVIARSLSTLLTALILSFSASPILSVVMLSLVIVIVLCSFLESATASWRHEEDCKSAQKSMKVVVEAMGSIHTIVSMHKEQYFFRRFCLCLQRHSRMLQSGVAIRAAVVSTTLALKLSFYTMAFVTAFLCFSNADSKVTSGQFVSSIGSFLYSAILLSEVANLWPDLMQAKLAVLSLFRLIDSSKSERKKCSPLVDLNALRLEMEFHNNRDGNNNRNNPECSIEIQVVTANGTVQRADGRVTFQKVEFAYPTREEFKILRGLSFSVERGETVALVGASGAGKSTVIQLLQRFYAPSKGKIQIDGTNIVNIERSDLRRQMALISQDPVLFNGTIEENIAYGLTSEQRAASRDQVFAAARSANVIEFIHRLPHKFATRVGPSGWQLSASQRQRIAIARALFRDPAILLLDGVETATTGKSEESVRRALEQASKGRSCIVIAHRLQTAQVAGADRIVVLHNGRAVEQGSHQQLINLKGHYYRLYHNSAGL